MSRLLIFPILIALGGVALAESASVQVVDENQVSLPGTTVWGIVRNELSTWKSDENGRVEIPAQFSRQRDHRYFVVIDKDRIGWLEFEGRSAANPEITGEHQLEALPFEMTKGELILLNGDPARDVEIVYGSFRKFATDRFPALRYLPPEALKLLPRARTDQKGQFEIPIPQGVETGTLRVHDERYVAEKLELVTGEDGIQIEAPPLRKGAIVEGRLVHPETGEPLVGMWVAAQSLKTGNSTDWIEARTDSEGNYQILGLSAGVYNILFLGQKELTAVADDGIELSAGDRVTAALKVIRGEMLSGVVLDEITGKPLSGAHVGCFGPSRPRSGTALLSTVSDEKGRFKFHVPAGIHEVEALDGKARALVVVQKNFDPHLVLLSPAPRPSEENDPLSPSDKVTGQVLDPYGKPISNATVFTPFGNGPEAKTNREGKFVLKGVVPRSKFLLMVRKNGYHVWVRTAGAGEDLDIKLDPK